MQNPYWIAYRNLRLNQKKRYMLSAQLSYDITDWLNISGRVRVDNTHTKYEQKLYASSNLTITEESTQGHYTISKPDETQTYADVLANINKRFNDFSLVANVGASIVNNRYEDLSYRGPIREKGNTERVQCVRPRQHKEESTSGRMAGTNAIRLCQCRSRLEKHALSDSDRT